MLLGQTWPSANAPDRSTISLSMDMPWDLWMLIAHARHRGRCVRMQLSIDVCVTCSPPESVGPHRPTVSNNTRQRAEELLQNAHKIECCKESKARPRRSGGRQAEAEWRRQWVHSALGYSAGSSRIRSAAH